MSTNRDRNKNGGLKILQVGGVCFVLVILIAVMSLLSLMVGSAGYGLSDIIDLIFREAETPVAVVFLNLRLPRIVLALIVGMSLSVAGALLQSVMRNPLADPGTIGVSAGASTAAVTVLLLFPTLTTSVPIFAFLGATFACLLIYLMAWKDGINPIRIILSGVAINSVLGAYTAMLQMMNSDRLQGVLSFLNGSLSGRNWSQVHIALVYGVIGLVLGFCCIKQANILLLGDEMAKSLGINVSRSRIFLSAVSAFLAASTVSVVGMIGFVGLVVPHIARILVGSDYKALLPVCALLGSLVLLIADTIGRILIPGMEVPVGIITAVTGGPFFLYMLKKGGRVYGN